MKIVKGVLFVLSIILFCSNQLQAQNTLFDTQDLSQTNIDDVSDNQLISLYNKAIEAGVDESDIYKILAQKGLPPTEIVKLRERLRNLSPTKKTFQKNDLSIEKD
ncbi:MAG: hypothetical protein ACTHOB_07790, partial [Ginsengibacter sp.]